MIKRFIFLPNIFLLMQLISIYSIFLVFKGTQSFISSTDSITIGLTLVLLFGFSAMYLAKCELNCDKVVFQPKGFFIIPFIIIFCSCFEYLTLGVPAFNQISYHIFGFPILHHVSVSSWLLLFCVNKNYDNKYNSFLVAFAFLNPLLMVNRDLFLLTTYSSIVLLLLNKKISWKYLIGFAAITLLVFGYVGQLRSPTGIRDMNLPFAFDKFKVFPPFVWLMTYFSAPMLNMHLTMHSLSDAIPFPTINTFPEVTTWIRDYNLGGMLFFYGLILAINTAAYLLSFRYVSFFPFFIYLNYQSIMTLFSAKYFRTNTLFVGLFLLMVYLADNLFSYSKGGSLEKSSSYGR